jgi:hypothetical protein
VKAHELLFQGEVQGLILSIYENERPMRGLAGVVDWKLCGEISSLLRLGGLSGKLGTCTYIPVQWNDRVLQEVISPIQNKVGQFLSSALIRNIVGQTVSSSPALISSSSLR